ncbi:MAG TPA: hypothetical protein P5061_10225, partial [Mycobacterium sp.]|nr:hypothetical protein [Mycobacterium sp.]
MEERVASARYVGRVGALALALGVSSAVAGGHGVAAADDGDSGARDNAPSASSSESTSTGAAESSAGNDRRGRALPKVKDVADQARAALAKATGSSAAGPRTPSGATSSKAREAIKQFREGISEAAEVPDRLAKRLRVTVTEAVEAPAKARDRWAAKSKDAQEGAESATQPTPGGELPAGEESSSESQQPTDSGDKRPSLGVSPLLGKRDSNRASS